MQIFRDLSLHAAAGQSVALVGESGSGALLLPVLPILPVLPFMGLQQGLFGVRKCSLPQGTCEL